MKLDEDVSGSEGSITFECEFAAPPDKVWRALTVPELVAAWLFPNDMRPETGHWFTLEAGPQEGGATACEVLAAEPPRLLRYSWRGSEAHGGGDALDTVVTFLLTATPGGTHLRIVHDGFAALPLTSAPRASRTASRLHAPTPRRDRRVNREGARRALRPMARPPLRLAA